MSEIDLSVAEDETPAFSRREFVRTIASRSLKRRLWFSRFYMALVALALVVAAVPLFSIIYAVVKRGYQFINVHFLTQSQLSPSIMQPKGIGGVSNAIVGTVLIDGIAAAIAIPVALLVAMALYEINNRATSGLRLALEVMIGQPSILLGIFVYTVIVVPISHGVGTVWAGSLAIAMLMIPFIAIAADAALRDVPVNLIEAGRALGARPSRIMRRVILPFALPRVLTGVILALSRAVGETAPILFVTGVSLVVNWSPNGQATALPALIYQYFTSSFPYLKQAAWGIALILITGVLIINLTSRLLVSKLNKGRN